MFASILKYMAMLKFSFHGKVASPRFADWSFFGKPSGCSSATDAAGALATRFRPMASCWMKERRIRKMIRLPWTGPPLFFYGYPILSRRISPLTVTPDAFADFYIRVFNEWVRNDVGRVFVQFFDAALGNVLGAPSGVCCYSAVCGHAAALEANGDLYPCDHYVYPEYRLGNIMETPMLQLLNSQTQRDFGEAKLFSLSAGCQTCDVLPLCHGGCPKDRFGLSAGGKSGVNYLCAGYRRIFRHMQPVLQRMAALINDGVPASAIMTQIHQLFPSASP